MTDNTGHYEGMTKREYFAAKAMAALIVAMATQERCGITRNDICAEAVNYADGMLAALAALAANKENNNGNS